VRVSQITFTAIGQVTTTDADHPPAPGEEQVLVAPSHVGICGSDLAVLTGHHPWTRPPVVTGHEVAGWVLETGPGVRRVAPGDLVVVNPLQTCGTCPRCRAGAVNQCEDGAVRGYRRPGAGVTRLLLDENELHRVPPGMAPEHACLAEPLAAAWHAATRTDDLGEVAVIGAGSIGQLVLAALSHRRAGRIIVIEPEDGKRNLARACGADDAVPPGRLPATPRFTAVFDCVSRPATLEWAVGSTLAGGAVVTVGVPAAPVTMPLPRMQRYEIAQLGSGLYTPADLDTAVSLIASGQVDADPLISGVYPLGQVARAYARAQAADSVKVMVAMA
jgi:2-desacetyl-2-hydroxyethyl bacteriochlorophyllide A dehydrogenase